jgi:uncharacterized membrane protein YkoI
MGMLNSDDDLKIISEDNLMKIIIKNTPNYYFNIIGMNEDQKIIYEESLKKEFLNKE